MASAPPASSDYARYVRCIGLIGLICTGLWLSTMYHLVQQGGLFSLDPAMSDFLNYWAGPIIAKHDIHALFHVDRYMEYLRDIRGDFMDDHNWSYPLHLLFFVTPLSLLPIHWALVLWLVAGVACLFWSSRLWFTHSPTRTLSACALLLSPAALVGMASGQHHLFLSALTMMALVFISRNRPTSAGLALGILTIKPHLFLCWPFFLLLRKQWKVIIVAVLTAAFLIGLSVVVYGAESWSEYFTNVPKLQLALLKIEPEEFIRAPFMYHEMMLGLTISLGLAHVPFTIALNIHLLISFCVLVLTLLALCKNRLSFSETALLLASGALLITTYALNYDLLFFTAALLLYWQDHLPRTVYQRWLHGIAYLLPVLVYAANRQGIPLVTLTLLLVFLQVAWPAIKSQRQNVVTL